MGGKLIVFEGIDGSGKDTQIRCLKRFLEKAGKKVAVFSYPTKKGIGKIIRNLVKKDTDPSFLTLLFISEFVRDRKQILDYLKKGYFVILNRYYFSTFAYQTAGGVDPKIIKYLVKAFELPQPDVVFYLDVKPENAVRRLKKRDNFENVRFLKKVRKEYKKILPKNTVVIDAEKNKKDVKREILEHLEKII